MQENILMSFGQTIRKIRLSKGISQEKFADMCDLHRTYISDIELNNNFIFKTIYGDVVTTSPVITNIAESAKLIATTRSGSEYAFDLTKKTVSGPATNNLEVHYTNNLDLDVDKRVTVFAEQENNSIGFTTSPIVSIQSIKEYELLRNNTMDIENNMQLN